ncbi:low affinity immunoglobulin gamma Fc region receptor II-b isoform X1 [Rhinolophus sinicus]|uniref:low affinity immunoglobulin gamma Fc region receptor II-b isoform X1 n=1 Tax=Rhinolophus sinicus TaxID=89399 RepID=UPI003D7AA505
MGAPSLRHRADHMSCHPLGHMLLWTALLFVAPGAGTPATLPKAVLSLQPPWINLLQEDNVTLSCQGPQAPGNSPTRWFHNGNPIPAQVQPSYHLQVSSSDSGNYSCQTDQTSLSDPVHLDVVSDWLLLQTPRLVFQAGESIKLRCHSWRNRPLHKITFYHNGKSKMFSYQNSSFSIPQANASHSGDYHCLGIIGRTQHMSQPVTITIQGPSSGNTFLVMLVVFVMVGIASVAAITAMVVCFRRRLRHSSGSPERREKGQAAPEKPANVTNAEEAAEKEENTITYSLLLHPEAQEQDPEPNDYQNM